MENMSERNMRMLYACSVSKMTFTEDFQILPLKSDSHLPKKIALFASLKAL